MADIKDSIVFIDEGNEFVFTDEFAAAVQDTDNYYVIATREGIPSLPYSIEEIYFQKPRISVNGIRMQMYWQ